LSAAMLTVFACGLAENAGSAGSTERIIASASIALSFLFVFFIAVSLLCRYCIDCLEDALKLGKSTLSMSDNARAENYSYLRVCKPASCLCVFTANKVKTAWDMDVIARKSMRKSGNTISAENYTYLH
jgi:hypothetical protein